MKFLLDTIAYVGFKRNLVQVVEVIIKAELIFPGCFGRVNVWVS
jgi:hypothetical protein